MKHDIFNYCWPETHATNELPKDLGVKSDGNGWKEFTSGDVMTKYDLCLWGRKLLGIERSDQ